MSKVCEICNKGALHGSKVSHSNKKSKKTWSVNIKKIKAIIGSTPKTVKVCTRCLRSGKVNRNA